MDNYNPVEISPYRKFSKNDWAKLRADTPLTLTQPELDDLQGLNERVSMNEVEQIYLPLSRLLNLYVAAAQQLFQATQSFLGSNGRKMPYIIGLAGSVAVGKSTTARLLQALLARWPNHPKVDLVPTDGFLLPNAELKKRGLMERKGFPRSYDRQALLQFLSDVKAGRRNVTAPVYSHLSYDVLGTQVLTIDQPDILIVEGLNVLQTGKPPKGGTAIPYVSDYFDFSVYIHAKKRVLEQWYIERFLQLRETSFRNPSSYFHKYAGLSDEQAEATARDIWRTTNLPNLSRNILPTRQRADLILSKNASHRIASVELRKL